MDLYNSNLERRIAQDWKEGNDWETEFTMGPCQGMIHVIQPGDTLYRLSQRYHVTVEEIMYQNPYVNIYNLQIGDELCIPIMPKTSESVTRQIIRDENPGSI